jgi:hypothetical protein
LEQGLWYLLNRIGNFSSSWTTVSFSRRAVLLGVSLVVCVHAQAETYKQFQYIGVKVTENSGIKSAARDLGKMYERVPEPFSAALTSRVQVLQNINCCPTETSILLN